MKKSIKPNVIGYTVLNTKNGKYLDTNGRSVYEFKTSFVTWHTPKGAQEVLDEIDHIINDYNNKVTRKLKRNRKYFKVVKMINTFELV